MRYLKPIQRIPIEDILGKLYEEYGGGVAGKIQADCEGDTQSRKGCFACCAAQKKSDDWSDGWETMGGAAICIGGGAASQIGAIVTRNIAGFFTATGLKWACMGTTARSAYVAFKGNKTAEELCGHKCDNKFPNLDG